MYPKQRAALFHSARYGIVEASTKAGKTTACMVWLTEQALRGKPGNNYWWVAPVFSQAKIAFRRLKRALPKAVYTSNETELTITLINGTVVWFKGADKPDTLYGEDVYAAVIDEATRCKEEAWIAVRSTLTATRGPVRIIGNVKGRLNWAYQMARRAEAGAPGMRYAKLTAFDAVEGGVLAASEIEDARRTLPEDVFRELYLAEPRDNQALIYGSFSGENVSPDAVWVKGGGPLFVWYDWGFIDDTAILFVQYRAGRFYLFRELVGSGASEREWVRQVVRVITELDGYGITERDGIQHADPTYAQWEHIWTKREPWPAVWPEVWPEYAAGDPSAPQFRAELKEHGITARKPGRVKHEVEAGQDVLRAAILTAGGLRRLIVHPDCTQTIANFGRFRAKALEDGSFTPKPDPDPANHAYSHTCDAARYGIWPQRRFLGLVNTESKEEPPDDDRDD